VTGKKHEEWHSGDWMYGNWKDAEEMNERTYVPCVGSWRVETILLGSSETKVLENKFGMQ
jgi:hypothetical protein